MPRFEINLARYRVLPVVRRRVYYHVLILYLSLWGAAFTWVAYALAGEYAAVSQKGTAVARTERAVLAQYAGARGALEHCDRLRRELEGCAEQLESAERAMKGQVLLGSILAAVVDPLPRAARLGSLDLNAAKGEVLLDVVAPSDSSPDDLTAATVVAAWGHSGALASEVSQIALLNTQRVRVDGKPSNVWRFSGKMNVQAE